MVSTNSPDPVQAFIPRRYLKAVIYLLCVFGILTTLSFFSGLAWDDARNWSPFRQEPPQKPKTPPSSLDELPNYPPNYTEWHEIEEALPQHDASLMFPEGKEGRYVYFSEHVKSAFIFLACTPVDLTPNPHTLSQPQGGGTYFKNISSRDCWLTSDEDRA